MRGGGASIAASPDSPANVIFIFGIKPLKYGSLCYSVLLLSIPIDN
jgi:hypothetical protein